MNVSHSASRILCVLLTVSTLGISACSFDTVLGEQGIKTTSAQDAQTQASQALSPKVNDSALIDPKTLTVGIKTRAATAPFVMNPKDSSAELSGFDIDLAYALADALGLKVNFVEVSDAAKSLGKTCDVMLSAKKDDARSAKVVGAYAESAAALFGKNKSTTPKAQDLQGKRLALQKGSLSELVLKRSSLTMVEVPCQNLNEAFDALAQGSVDYVLCEAYTGAYLGKNIDGVSCVGTLDLPNASGVAVDAKNTTLQTAVQTALSDLQSNGIYQLIRTRWVGSQEPFSQSAQIKGLIKPKPKDPNTQDATSGTSSSDQKSNKSADAKNTSDAGDKSANPSPQTAGSNAVNI